MITHKKPKDQHTALLKVCQLSQHIERDTESPLLKGEINKPAVKSWCVKLVI